MRQVRPSIHHVAATVALCAGAAVALLGTYDAAGERYLPAPWGAVLFSLVCAAYVAYGYGQGERRAIWTGAWVSALAIVVLELIAHALGAGDVGNPDPDDPVMSPAMGLLVLPVLLALIAAGVGLRGWRDRR